MLLQPRSSAIGESSLVMRHPACRVQHPTANGFVALLQIGTVTSAAVLILMAFA
ncbi:MAG: aa3-type cytochrome c oxidase subunit IV [Ottowia sp.]|nr:aa3-type cytochrome c oxidase subunit IV [Ottowia sp.]